MDQPSAPGTEQGAELTCCRHGSHCSDSKGRRADGVKHSGPLTHRRLSDHHHHPQQLGPPQHASLLSAEETTPVKIPAQSCLQLLPAAAVPPCHCVEANTGEQTKVLTDILSAAARAQISGVFIFQKLSVSKPHGQKAAAARSPSSTSVSPHPSSYSLSHFISS